MAVRYAEGRLFTEEDMLKNMVIFLCLHSILLITSYGNCEELGKEGVKFDHFQICLSSNQR